MRSVIALSVPPRSRFVVKKIKETAPAGGGTLRPTSFPQSLPRGGPQDSVSVVTEVGRLLSLSVLILDQYIPGEWF